MSNVSGSIATGVTVTLGIFGMKNDDFGPTTVFFYCVGIAAAAFIISFMAEALQSSASQAWQNLKHRFKRKKNDMGLGNRHL